MIREGRASRITVKAKVSIPPLWEAITVLRLGEIKSGRNVSSCLTRTHLKNVVIVDACIYHTCGHIMLRDAHKFKVYLLIKQSAH